MGRTVRCPSCAFRFDILPPSEPPATAQVIVYQAETRQGGEDRPRRRRRRREDSVDLPRRGAGWGPALVTICVSFGALLTIGVCCLGIIVPRPRQPEAEAAEQPNPKPVKQPARQPVAIDNAPPAVREYTPAELHRDNGKLMGKTVRVRGRALLVRFDDDFAALVFGNSGTAWIPLKDAGPVVFSRDNRLTFDLLVEGKVGDYDDGALEPDRLKQGHFALLPAKILAAAKVAAPHR